MTRLIFERDEDDTTRRTRPLFRNDKASNTKPKAKAKAKAPWMPVLMVTGYGDIPTAVNAVKLGASDFIEKPLDLNRLLITIRNALDKSSLITETKVLKRKVSKGNEMIGESKAILQVKEIIDKVAPTDARVLITGSNGTGKELVARSLHENSSRAAAPFIEVNCAAIPSELIESELFGHEKGAFTGAVARKKGRIEMADKGTLFLDEIGDLNPASQVKLLRLLQEGEYLPLGADRPRASNARIVLATNVDQHQVFAVVNLLFQGVNRYLVDRRGCVRVVEAAAGRRETRGVSGVHVAAAGEVVDLAFFVGFDRNRLVAHSIGAEVVSEVQLGGGTRQYADSRPVQLFGAFNPKFFRDQKTLAIIVVDLAKIEPQGSVPSQGLGAVTGQNVYFTGLQCRKTGFEPERCWHRCGCLLRHRSQRGRKRRRA